jgi:hypothetical protein
MRLAAGALKLASQRGLAEVNESAAVSRQRPSNDRQTPPRGTPSRHPVAPASTAYFGRYGSGTSVAVVGDGPPPSLTAPSGTMPPGH